MCICAPAPYLTIFIVTIPFGVTVYEVCDPADGKVESKNCVDDGVKAAASAYVLTDSCFGANKLLPVSTLKLVEAPTTLRLVGFIIRVLLLPSLL